MISVIVPVYNAEKTLVDCINSIVKSVEDIDYEIILVNDGSVDSSLELCKKMSEENPSVKFYDKENGGPASARNLGLIKAVGEYIAFSDADDLWKGSFAKVWEPFTRKIDIDLFVSPIYRCMGENIESSPIKTIQPGIYDLPPNYFFTDGLIHTSCGKIYKSSIIKEYEIMFPDYRLSEDTIFNLRYLFHCKKIYLTNYGYYLYLNSTNESLTTRINELAIPIYKLVEEELRCFFIQKNYPEYEKTLNATMFPQFYGMILKVLIKKELSYLEKKQRIRAYKKEYDVNSLIKSVQHNSLGEKILCELIVHNMYGLAIVVLRFRG